MAGFFETGEAGLRLTVRLTPRAAHDRIDGIEAGADGAEYLKARVRAVPENGKANAALCALLAKQFGIAKSAVTLVSGASARMKVLALSGDADRLAGLAQSFKDRS